MNKFIIILLFIPFWANAQTVRTFQSNEDWSFKSDKWWHTGFGVGSSFVIFKGVDNMYGTNEEDALIAACVIPSCFALGKEMLDFLMNKPMSWSDVTYTSGTAILTGATMYGLKKWRNKRQAKKIKKKFDVSENINYSLNNPIFIK